VKSKTPDIVPRPMQALQPACLILARYRLLVAREDLRIAFALSPSCLVVRIGS
jgi:hypothetical protein